MLVQPYVKILLTLKETGQNSVPEKQIIYLGFHLFFISEMSLPVHLK